MFKTILVILGLLAIAFGGFSLLRAPTDANAAFTTGYYAGAGFWIVVGAVVLFFGSRLRS